MKSHFIHPLKSIKFFLFSYSVLLANNCSQVAPSSGRDAVAGVEHAPTPVSSLNTVPSVAHAPAPTPVSSLNTVPSVENASVEAMPASVFQDIITAVNPHFDKFVEEYVEKIIAPLFSRINEILNDPTASVSEKKIALRTFGKSFDSDSFMGKAKELLRDTSERLCKTLEDSLLRHKRYVTDGQRQQAVQRLKAWGENFTSGGNPEAIRKVDALTVEFIKSIQPYAEFIESMQPVNPGDCTQAIQAIQAMAVVCKRYGHGLEMVFEERISDDKKTLAIDLKTIWNIK